MFAGIVEHVGTLVAARPLAGAGDYAAAARRLDIDLGPLAEGLALGASVAVNGVCLTLAERRDRVGGFDAVPETLRLTNLGALRPGDPVNLERSLRVGDRIDGHFVQGHVEACAPLDRIDREGGGYKLWIAAPRELAPFILPKGSITVDGVSMTVVDATDDRFSIVVIPTTWQRTTLGRRAPGDRLNLESDILARIVVHRLERAARARDDDAPANIASGVDWNQLRAAGFVA
ncbi:MAG: riboflavin synthase [Phycisphaerae bacterium]